MKRLLSPLAFAKPLTSLLYSEQNASPKPVLLVNTNTLLGEYFAQHAQKMAVVHRVHAMNALVRNTS